jgi:protein arginine N-methyltransferase 1
MRNISLIATDAERLQTSKSMYHDYKCRVSTHPSWMTDERRITKFMSLFDTATKGKSVLFIGGGMGFGLLPLLCARRGASRVVAVDDSTVIESCVAIAKANKFEESQLQFLQGKILPSGGVALDPSQKFDFIFCEWVANFLTNDTPAIEELVYARDTYLAKGGDVLPSRATLSAVGISDYDFFQTSVEWWANVYGFKMQTMRDCVMSEPSTGSVPVSTVVTTAAKVVTIDFKDLKAGEKNNAYDASFKLKVTRASTTIHYVTVYPVVEYCTSDGISMTISYGPADPQGTLSPTSICLPQYVPVLSGEELAVSMSVVPVPSTKPPRVTVTLKGVCDSAISKSEFEKVYSYADYR